MVKLHNYTTTLLKLERCILQTSTQRSCRESMYTRWLLDEGVKKWYWVDLSSILLSLEIKVFVQNCLTFCCGTFEKKKHQNCIIDGCIVVEQKELFCKHDIRFVFFFGDYKSRTYGFVVKKKRVCEASSEEFSIFTRNTYLLLFEATRVV